MAGRNPHMRCKRFTTTEYFGGNYVVPLIDSEGIFFRKYKLVSERYTGSDASPDLYRYELVTPSR